MNVRNSMIKQSGPASLSVVEGCPLSGVPLYINFCLFKEMPMVSKGFQEGIV